MEFSDFMREFLEPWDSKNFKSLRNLKNFKIPEEFYVDGQPMCCHRQITAGTENANVTEAPAGKAGVTAIK